MPSADIEKQEHFLRLYLPQKDRLWRYIRSMVWQNDDARDIESETVLQAFLNLEKLRSEETFLYFLFGIASRLLKQKERKKRLQSIFLLQKTSESEFNDPGHKMDVDIVHLAIKKLPSKERETIILFEISGLSLKEIQDLQGASISAIKTRLSRARQKLGKMLNPASPEIQDAKKENDIETQQFFINGLKVNP